ncbi:TonB-dependent receptor [Paraglaciecola sp. L3A3]|uniref:TonB-dependent receptor n=1 Tax=Paraglaciecola sp. L3A3 TaxID=2686358 RepID=UPI00131CCCDF|nr:TonB-dependent receptor [Paraglaciecola sp. L3A3]
MTKHINNNNFSKTKLSLLVARSMKGAALSLLIGSSHFSALAQQGGDSSVDAEEADGTEVIQVRGLRSSLDRAKLLKRDAGTVIEAITSEDIGQFSDDSIAGALQRVPGIQIERDDAGTDGDRVSIRGLGPEFVNSTVNGRTVLSAGNEGKALRKMNFNVFPPNILSGVRVAKGQTAASPESGLAGQVDLLTLRPLDMPQLRGKNNLGMVSVKGTSHDRFDDNGFTVNGLYAHKNKSEDFGFYIAAVVSEDVTSRDQVFQNYTTRDVLIENNGIPGYQDGSVDGESADTKVTGVTVPNSTNYRPIRSTAERTSLSAGAQWYINDEFSAIWDFTYSKFANHSHRNNLQINQGGIWAGTVFAADSVEIDENNILQYADFSDADIVGSIGNRIQTMEFDNTTDNLITGLNLKWQKDDWTISLDGSLSTLEYNQLLQFPIFDLNDLDETTYSIDLRGEYPTVSNVSSFSDPTNVSYVTATSRDIDVSGDNAGLKLDFKYDLDGEFITTIEFGASYNQTSLDVERRQTAAQFIAANLGTETTAAINATINGTQTPEVFFAGEGVYPSTWLMADFDEVTAIIPDLAGRVEAVRDQDSYDSEETVLAFYAQANIDTEIAGLPVTGNIGARYINTENTSNALTQVAGATSVFTEVGNDYWTFLPSVNVNFELDEGLKLRLAASKTLSRPDFQDMSPIGNITLPDDTNPDASDIGTATYGNPDLNPMTSLNFDITLEKYMENDGALVASIFYKDVSDFIIRSLESEVPLQGQDPLILFNVTRPINFSDGSVEGFEIGIFQPMDKLIPELEGFGFSANYTYVDSKFEKDVGNAGFGFPGTSKNNLNLMAYYENDVITTRVSYIWRDAFFRSLAGTGSQTTTARFTGETESLNINVAWHATKDLTLSLNGSNLTDSIRRDYIGFETTYLDAFAAGRSFAVTAAYKF